MCYADGDPHYHTFDGAVHHYMGTGEFIASQRSPLCPDLQDFQLIAHHESYNNPAVSFVTWIQLNVGTTKVKIGESLQIWVSAQLSQNWDSELL